ncbi:hypothetical protein I5E68_02945 [Novosphingobium sp. YJ-S2-02]|uniref:Tetratricopeptide repeat protein n=1 Tax=Novosphingobium aureum TaxID=2792964 RepID=A0A931MJN6_9SPHN|nr:hypothetical protein [Novosphingobium aureum]MBH0111908.1 hypothetical protein [Novosphingobium aureum]
MKRPVALSAILVFAVLDQSGTGLSAAVDTRDIAGEAASAGASGGESDDQLAARILGADGARARLPGFAARLAQDRSITGPGAWHKLSDAAAWKRLSRVRRGELQQARWDYARALVAAERGAEAVGVLDVMVQDDPDLAMVDNFRLARGAALIVQRRYEAGLASLDTPGLHDNPEACAWRMRGLAQSGFADSALQQLGCVGHTLEKPRPAAFFLAAARAAIEAGKPEAAMRWLEPLPDRDPAANLYRGRAQLALGKGDAARLRFSRVEESGTLEQRTDARLSKVEAEVAAHTIKPREALRKLDRIRYSWRGDQIEERALRLSYKLNDDLGDLSGALASGALLFRHFNAARQGTDFLPELRGKLAGALSPERKLPLEQAAGLYWNYRDLAPGGSEGDRMTSQLAARLQAAGLYERAADLLSYQLFMRAGQLARGPLSARVASLYVLAARPDRALETLRKSDDPSLPEDMIAARQRVEAVALNQIGRPKEALAVLEAVPGSEALQAEILWKRQEWERYAAASGQTLPGSGALDKLGQASVLRQAIALAMLGREAELAALNQRYGAAFAKLPSKAAFELLTGAPGNVSPAALSRALAALPANSPAGDIGDLLEQAPPVGAAGD